MTLKPLAIILSLGLVLPGISQAVEPTPAPKPSAEAKMMHDEEMEKKCAAMMEHKEGMGGMMKGDSKAEKKMAGDMKGCEMMKDKLAAAPAAPKSSQKPEDHLEHHPK